MAVGLPDRRDDPAAPRVGLIWGFDLDGGLPRPLADCAVPDDSLRWLHLNLADQSTRHWILHDSTLPPDAVDLLLSAETHQRALVQDDAVACVLHDLERDFDVIETARVGALRIVLAPHLIVTARHHPLRSADIIRDRLARTPPVRDHAMALDIIIAAISGTVAARVRDLGLSLQNAEDRLVEDDHPPTPRELVGVRRQLAHLHRLGSGMRDVLARLERDEDLPDGLAATVEKLSQGASGLESDIAAAQGQLRLLREELDLQEARRTNTNLYVLSIMSALMLPATLVTGIFGMNTGGLPLAHDAFGTMGAALLVAGAAGGTYVLLRRMGLMRR